jgi:hypothetical protein
MRKFSFLLLTLFIIPFAFAHPHPLYSISANDTHIKIHALHSQNIGEDYIKKNLILDGCDIFNVQQDENYLRMIETYVIMEHNCKELIILKNTLFQDYWGKIPVSANTEGFGQVSKGNNFFKLTGNFIIDIILIFFLGLLSSLIGDFIKFILPISIVEKTSKNKNFLYYSIFIHLVSTYIFVFFSLSYLSSQISSHVWLIFIILGVLLLLENYFTKKQFSPYLISAIPCPATIFIVTVFLKDRFLLSLITPLIIIGSELMVLLLIKKFIRIKKDYSKILPYIFIIFGIIVFVLYQLPLSSTQEINACQFDENTIKDYFMKLELRLRTSQTSEEIISYINSHDCTKNGSVEIGEDRFFFNASWINGKKISYSYEKDQLTHLDCG